MTVLRSYCWQKFEKYNLNAQMEMQNPTATHVSETIFLLLILLNILTVITKNESTSPKP